MTFNISEKYNELVENTRALSPMKRAFAAAAAGATYVGGILASIGIAAATIESPIMLVTLPAGILGALFVVARTHQFVEDISVTPETAPDASLPRKERRGLIGKTNEGRKNLLSFGGGVLAAAAIVLPVFLSNGDEAPAVDSDRSRGGAVQSLEDAIGGGMKP